jgi:pyruvoyl-dependent arginine decarboxylase
MNVLSMVVPIKCFFTKGVGIHKDKLASFELALRKAGIEKFNLVYVSSIFPPNCKQITSEEGLKNLGPGQIAYCVMARNETNEPNRLISAAIGLARPKSKNEYGYLSEHHAFGETDETVNRRVLAVVNSSLKAIVCIGETLAEREAGRVHNVITQQLGGGLAGLTRQWSSTASRVR